MSAAHPRLLRKRGLRRRAQGIHGKAQAGIQGQVMRVMCRAVLAAVALVAAAPALAAWPERPIKVLIGYAPGGSTDLVARMLSVKLAEKLGQPIVIENKPGSAGDF